jgi:hypothetical protein
VVYSVDTSTSSLPLKTASTCGSVTAREAAASMTACSSLELSAPDDGGGATGSTTSVATTSPL